MRHPITATSIEQEFIELFPQALSRPESNLVATFNYRTITVENHRVTIDKPGEWIQQVIISNIRDIEYSSGMLIFHLQVGEPIEVNLI